MAYPVRYFLNHVEGSVGSTSTIWQTFDSEEEALTAINIAIQRINTHFREPCDSVVKKLKSAS